MLILFTVLLINFAFGNTDSQSDATTLRFAAIIYRHGDRSPTRFYPTDPHKDYDWPGGVGALSPEGALQLYNLGKHLRSRYHCLFPSNGMYSKDNMFVLSSAVERCLMSAQSFLAGFLPPPMHHKQLPILWQPVAINSIPKFSDKLVAQAVACPKYDKLLNQMYTNPSGELKDYFDKNAAVFSYLANHTGTEMNILYAEMLYFTLSIEEAKGLALPEWTKKLYPEKLEEMTKRSLAILTETPFMKRVKGGPLLTDIVDKMLNKKYGTLNPNRSLFIYSGHDLTLLSVMRALNINNQTSHIPDYGSTLAMELHGSDAFANDFEVKILYYFNATDEISKEVSIPNCTSPCSLTNFVGSIQHIIVRNYDEICKSNGSFFCTMNCYILGLIVLCNLGDFLKKFEFYAPQVNNK